ncbi:tRNA (adenosine(37)-N6)-threonylcarbamoyltransferase complex dimerization subunit type 1 TsaB [Ilyomonas limi]|uniref:tRNA (Adenosine(37)-N6)-threonylcarbamoyltransferase complex dimerization subunit type 1 TsaB n=1 Tax=Ilyomonas limi TaxID=2575867 RepID=A0A4U3L6L7_9BACT|nr:tRNA (adenosine(37)-N6)-threonylcarbamoyltransferase complex dimerization subunit type 1 TsaB [Ilyomonas limi]TKK70885.1 tRNA (adenosine(37)-N6)-threonylcarbamoyltransferase complex dimerization subunit type 1 TsaB [Ilyomonas limi]
MALILNIDTSTNVAAVGFANENGIIAVQTSEDQKNHAAFVQSAIHQLMQWHQLVLQNIDAVAVVNGPGSYTGLRVGLASAKGLCFALNKPLILLNTLEVMALASVTAFPDENTLHCPMIDARRMEVFAAVYNRHLQALLPPQPIILSANSFNTFLQFQKVVFSGSGQKKVESIINHQNAIFSQVAHTIQQINMLAQQAFNNKKFADLAYSEPYYLKNFYTL